MIKTALCEDEKIIIRKYQKYSSIKLIREKSQAILMRDDNLPINKIALYLLKGERTIKRWISEYRDKRIGSLFSGYEKNENASKLTRVQKEEITKVLRQKPIDSGIPKEFWDIPNLKKYVKAEFGVQYESKQSYYFLLTFANLSFKYPSTFDIRRNEEEIRKRMKEIHEEIKPMLESAEWEIFASDESKIMLEAITRKAWLKKGEKTVIKVARKRESQSMIGFLNMKNKKCHIYGLEWQNQKEIIKAIRKFLERYPNKKICIIWDNAKFHKGNLIKETLSKGEIMERVHLINMPPYAPDHNPIEHVWGFTKQKVSNIQGETITKIFRRFINIIHGHKFDYSI